ncbi:flagellar basal body P-ring formation chaperone FlgA [Marinimicrobium sp. ABcell2]|uniref:flagellar basal body P-ring formation chaperone FlgA n=1 Tax=Marinimicrobium sp. ABcell2 TaxID=3069751 RepID=UPI0027B59BFA|nr:flagellar basal body P-ring formation chaperone FlgA [Marinimicrobium sp. ABcell2]MDQ2075461.1 flagellar basal body P-ring formation chaperone FlgA [Marinimicrobium sp. ABcell2]
MHFGAIWRTFFCAPRLWAKAGLAFVSLTLGATPALAERHDLEQLREQVAQFLSDHYAQSGAQRVAVEVGRLDPRLHLAECGDLEMRLNDASNNGGNVSVHSRCRGDQPWSIYVPAQVDLYRPVAVAARNLGRSTRLSDTDVTLELRNTSRLRQGFVDTEAAVVGMELRRPLERGEPFRAGLLVEPLAVNRGDEVRLEAEVGGISVSTRGTAMSGGRVGQQIRVMNNSSERIVAGEIVAPGHVKTIL